MSGTISGTIAARARVAVSAPARFMEQLCRHFEHKCPVTRSDGRARIAFEKGNCEIEVSPDTLDLRVAAASEADLSELADVVARHLARFAFREAPVIGWMRPAP